MNENDNDGSRPEHANYANESRRRKRKPTSKGGHKKQLIEIKVSRYFVQGIQL